MQTDAQPGNGAPYARYVQHLRAGELAYQFSPAAGRAVFFPRVRCPYSGQDCLEWRISAGLGTVYSTSVVYPRKGDPYNVALIDLDEGFRLMSRVVIDDPMQVAIGQRVRFQAASEEGLDDPIPVFAPLEPAQ
ncbi:Zn-ribbon domain-containing OB-fold protein [Bordetella sp. BOR01]|uniref:Zn-ribbon domain-containing OB-fold protein n=1 Tax=Bordetella sp. BOR01 TaxID=2854779 RepID=UPI001C45E923|nr:OB-fold domain-containing protein [Bordetella sp. BOR01]MBV7484604.1 OB-fold domain-containing protein [Bordetella sp. BOR01]